MANTKLDLLWELAFHPLRLWVGPKDNCSWTTILRVGKLTYRDFKKEK